MSVNIWKHFNVNLLLKTNNNFGVSVRHGHHLRGKPPELARNLAQRVAEIKYQDPAIHFKVDIGLPPPQQYSRLEQSRNRMSILKANRSNAELEAISRNKKLLINIDECKEEWLKTSGPYDIKKVADHYGVFQHLFGDAYFYPRVCISINYHCNDAKFPVYYGNTIKPKEASTKPEVLFESDDNSLWTLILTNPDGHFTNQNAEYVHWFIGNIPGNKIEKGETIVNYLQPFPPKGTGYHRFIFILYKQDKKMDFTSFKKDGDCLTLSERTFSTYNFYKDHQDLLTPAGLAFFQSDWDPSLTDFYHNVLNMKEPTFEYDFPPPYLRPQEWFPLRQPFNLYMDRYRDPKQINKEFLVRKLKNVNPFKAPPPPLPYPNAQYFDSYKPSWLKLEIRKSRLKWGRINEIE